MRETPTPLLTVTHGVQKGRAAHARLRPVGPRDCSHLSRLGKLDALTGTGDVECVVDACAQSQPSVTQSSPCIREAPARCTGMDVSGPGERLWAGVEMGGWREAAAWVLIGRRCGDGTRIGLVTAVLWEENGE